MVACVIHYLLGAPDGHRRFGGNFCRALQGRSQHGVLRVKHLVHQPAAQRPGRAHAPAGVGQLFDDAQRNQLGQALQGADVGHQANVDFLNAEKRVCRGVAHAAGGHHVDRAANAAALDGGNDGNAQGLDFGESTLDVLELVKNGRAALGRLVAHQIVAVKRLKCHAGTEMLAGAGDHQHPGLCALVQVRQHAIKLAPESGVHGVQGLRLAEHQVGHVVADAEREARQAVVVSGSVHGATLSHALNHALRRLIRASALGLKSCLSYVCCRNSSFESS